MNSRSYIPVVTKNEKIIEQLKEYQRMDKMGHFALDEYLKIIYESSEDAVREVTRKNDINNGLMKQIQEAKEILSNAFDLLNHKSEVEK